MPELLQAGTPGFNSSKNGVQGSRIYGSSSTCSWLKQRTMEEDDCREIPGLLAPQVSDDSSVAAHKTTVSCFHIENLAGRKEEQELESAPQSTQCSLITGGLQCRHSCLFCPLIFTGIKLQQPPILAKNQF
ncbi:hypothetical protein O6P43_012028 [Quillaja saponaria]|uniref:Uncharacterized protein n=1 Tax=Quillaja saponaria TaxID=32244 RepID=A0AAD7M0R3_QUISA|nr:hypothetical protein O6P43_012028 [Quillaja saponaria]